MFERTVRQPAATIAGAIDLAAQRIERVRQITLGVELGTVEVSQRDAITADADLTGDSLRHPLLTFVEDPHRGVSDGSADADAAVDVRHGPERGIHRRLGGPIAIPHRGAALEQRGGEIRRQRFSARDRLETLVTFPARLEQDAPARGRGLHDSRPAGFQQRTQRARVAYLLARRDDHPGAHGERQHEFEDGDVEGDRRDSDQRVLCFDAGRARETGKQIRDGGVRYLHALGPAGGAGGIDDVGGGAGCAGGIVLGQAGGRCGGDAMLILVQQQRLFARQAYFLRVLAFRDQRAERRVRGHEGETFGGEGGIQRHVCATRLQDADDGRYHVEIPVDAQADIHAAVNAEAAQRMRDPVRARVECGIGEAVSAELERDSVRGPVYLALDEFVHEHVVFVGGARRLQSRERGQGLRRDQAQLAQCLAAIRDGVAQQRHVGVEPSTDGDLVEQLGVVLDFEAQLGAHGHRVHEQFEILRHARIGVEFETEAGKTHGTFVQRLVHVEQHAHQRQAARVAFDGQLLQQCAEGVALMLESVEQLRTRVLDEAGDRRRRIDVESQRQQVHAMAHESGFVRLRLTGGGKAHDHGLRARDAMEQGGERAGQRGRKPCAELRAELPHVRRQRGIERDVRAP